MATTETSQYLEIFSSRRDQCHALLQLSRRQQALIESDDYTGLLVVLGQKQLVLGRLDEMKSRHAEALGHWKRNRETLDAATLSDCEHLLAETESILAELIQEEDNSTQQIVQRRDETHVELQAVSQGGRVNRAYRDALAPATHRHLDVNH